MTEKTTIQQMEDEISKRQNQKTQNINVRISPATKADVITKAAELNLTLSEYVEYVLTNEENIALNEFKQKSVNAKRSNKLHKLLDVLDSKNFF